MVEKHVERLPSQFSEGLIVAVTDSNWKLPLMQTWANEILNCSIIIEVYPSETRIKAPLDRWWSLSPTNSSRQQQISCTLTTTTTHFSYYSDHSHVVLFECDLI